MIYFDGDNVSKQLTRADINTIFDLLMINDRPNVDDFLANEGSERTFYELFFEVLRDKNVPVAIDIDWRWEPGDIFWQVNDALPEQDFHFDEVTGQMMDYDKSGNAKSWYIEWLQQGKERAFTVDFAHPDQLFVAFEKLMPDHQFIAINFFEDRYSWLVAPKYFNGSKFCELTGCTVSSIIDELNAEPTKPLKHKIFFYPTQIVQTTDAATSLVYCVNPEKDEVILWAGRILPGQTIKEGIASELKEMLGYSGDFSYEVQSLRDKIPDKRGVEIERYNVHLNLYDEVVAQTNVHGNNILLIEMEKRED